MSKANTDILKLRNACARFKETASRPSVEGEALRMGAGAETLADTIAHRFPEGVPDGVTVVGYRWADEDQ